MHRKARSRTTCSAISAGRSQSPSCAFVPARAATTVPPRATAGRRSLPTRAGMRTVSGQSPSALCDVPGHYRDLPRSVHRRSYRLPGWPPSPATRPWTQLWRSGLPGTLPISAWLTLLDSDAAPPAEFLAAGSRIRDCLRRPLERFRCHWHATARIHALPCLSKCCALAWQSRCVATPGAAGNRRSTAVASKRRCRSEPPSAAPPRRGRASARLLARRRSWLPSGIPTPARQPISGRESQHTRTLPSRRYGHHDDDGHCGGGTGPRGAESPLR